MGLLGFLQYIYITSCADESLYFRLQSLQIKKLMWEGADELRSCGFVVMLYMFVMSRICAIIVRNVCWLMYK